MAIITNLQPAPGEAIASDTPITFDVLDPVISTLRVYVWAVFADTGVVELVHDGENFTTQYSFSSITTITGGRRFSIPRVSGWPSAPELRVDTCACPPTLTAESSVVGGGWQEVYAVDFRTLDVTDLNTSGNTITIDGVTWQTPSVAANNDAMSAANTSFGVTANGLEVVGARSGLVNPNTITGNIIYASLYDISQNSATPFEADPSREYRFEAYVSAQNEAADTEFSGVLAFREGSTVAISNGLPGDGMLARTMLGQMGGSGSGTLEGAGDTGAGTPARQLYRAADLTAPPTSPNVAILHYKYGGHFSHGGGVWDTDAFPDNSDLTFFTVSRDDTDVENDIVAHPRYGFFVGVGHAASNTNNTYNAVIQQFRILQK